MRRQHLDPRRFLASMSVEALLTTPTQQCCAVPVQHRMHEWPGQSEKPRLKNGAICDYDGDLPGDQ
jgi:hypothetical protein